MKTALVVMKKFDGVGIRYLDSPERPLKWVIKPDFAFRFERTSPVDIAREVEGEILEVEA